ncbi:Fur family transcriptional regulator [Colwellia psychrerythraea]|uniref:Ferric uptake regulator, Fur family n=1 Tax=Colwellia psychrerythraea TaxID=28229 RepID=A0A099KC86_COLPS|nr:transcriptional repressor [Colwellia psychrerythraea]KGJ88354.1 ferric uptake regulator, Fur family [Colwellia psychrerythraea]
MHSTQNINQIITHAETLCKSHGARLTTKRKLVLSSLIQSGKALSAYDLIDLCKENFNENIPAMSVYRILEFLENEKLVHKLKLANKYVACSHITCNHDHGVPQFLICGTCDHVKEISINKSTISQLKNDVEQAGFQLINSQLEMNCICNSCQDKSA